MRKIPKKPKGKGKRWAKGHSCSSNPDTKKFRDAAKSRFFRHENSGPSALTVGALKTLDAFNNKKYGLKTSVTESVKDSDTFDASTVDSWASSKTFKTFASDWSNCSNMSFSRLLNKFEPKSFLHKEMLAVLAAVTEVIKSNGGKETSTEYFGALITTLGVTEEEETVAAILSLLSMGIKSVPSEVLRLKFSEITKVLLSLLAKYSEVENPVILRAVIGCLSVALRAQDPGVWSYPSTLQVFHSVLIFSTYTKPKVRKAGQHAVSAILKASALFTAEETHPAAATAAKYCIDQLESSSGLTGNTIILHILTLLKDIIGCFSRNYIKTTCETLLKLMTLGTPIVTSCSLEVLHNMFMSAPATRLDSILNAKILNALYDYQPSINDPQATVAWITVMQEAHRALARNDPMLCAENLGKFFITVTNLWLSDKNYILQGATACLRTVAMDCIKACSHSSRYPQICQNIFVIVENCLSYQYHSAWTQVFNLLGVLFEVIGKDGSNYMGSALKSLGNLRESHNFLYISELDYTVGKAIRALGPEIVLEAIPFVITGEEVNYEFKMSWLLPILKDNIQSSSLKYFIDHFLPMASICERKCAQLNASNEKIAAHSYDLLHLQLWSLLPAFANGSSDVKENFRHVAKLLGNLISGQKHKRIHAMAALRKLITRNQNLNNHENLEELSKYAKNYLPLLFNLYLTKAVGTDESGERLAAYETIGVYLTITSPEQCGDLFDRVLKRMEETDKEDLFSKESLMDILKLLLPYQNNERLNVVYEMCLKILKTTKCKKEEKKFYRLLEVIIGSQSENCKKFIDDKRKQIMTFLLKSMKNPKATTNRGVRLRCIFYAVKVLPKNQFQTIKSLVPEAIVCCKDINKRTRACAFRLLEEMFYIFRNWSNRSNEDTIKEYISIMIGGLAGTSTLASATVLALGKMTQVLKAEIPSDVIEMILQNICLLSGLQDREVVGATLDYMKTYLVSYHKDQVLPSVPTLMNALISMTDDCKNHFRLKTRDIFDRLIRKFSYDVIRSLVPAEDVTLLRRLKNLKRINAKKKESRSEGGKIEEEEDDYNVEFGGKTKSKSKTIEDILASSDESEEEEENKVPDIKKRKNKSALFIQEDADNIIDFISPNASSKISGKLPTQKIEKKKKENNMKFTADGRMIILDEPGDKQSSGDDDEDDDDDDLSDMDGLSCKMENVLIGRKRKISTSSEGPAKYQAGGSGIHRPIHNGDSAGKGRGTKKNKKHVNELPNLKTGMEYKARKARGDVKLKGKPDPYAYIPLSRKLLNRKQKMNSIVKSAIKGAKAGTKLKMKMKMKIKKKR
ncbi:hypothetical protein RUM43_003217 [Polyplax serrata]|uniref:RRP12-like protein n=1 Tax=Polyplax serrata TaxID=468196 RepID=A0AAN8NWA5_POLSC